MAAPAPPDPGAGAQPGAPVEVLGGGSGRPRLTDRWALLPVRTRRLAAAGAGAAVLAAAGAYGLAVRPEAPPPPPVPYPIQSTNFTYVSLDLPEPGARTFTAELSATSETGAVLQKVAQSYRGLSVTVEPPLPLTLEEGRSTRIKVRYQVRRCAGLPLRARLPFLQVTLRNARAIQDYSTIPGDVYARQLSQALRSVCGRSPAG